MPRKPADIAHVNLRIREHLRKRIEAAAKRNQVSLNSEVMQRLERSFEAETSQYLESLASKIEAEWFRISGVQVLLAWGDSMADGIGRERQTTNVLAELAERWRSVRASANLVGHLDETLAGETKS
jgi:Arc-like DNA binding dprotein